MFDINKGRETQKREEKGVEVLFEDENGVIDPDCKLIIVGTLSTTFRKNLDAMREKARDEQRELAEYEANDILAACAIKSWTGFIDGDKPFAHSLDNAVAFVTACPWMVGKIRVRSLRRASFFTKPSAVSSNPSSTTPDSRGASAEPTDRNEPTSQSSPAAATKPRKPRSSRRSATTLTGSNISEGGQTSSTAGAASA